MRCRCGSRRKYARCCGRWHGGKAAPTPEDLMRSRYAAYALGLVDYILDTTHPDGPHWRRDREAWASEVTAFCEGTTFRGLQVQSVEPGEEEGFVTFVATLSQGGRDTEMKERSRFLKRDGRWLYHSG